MICRNNDRIERVVYGKTGIDGNRKCFIGLIAATERVNAVDMRPRLLFSCRVVMGLLFRRGKKCRDTVRLMYFVEQTVYPFE